MKTDYNDLIEPLSLHELAMDLQDEVDASAFRVGDINFWMLVRQHLFLLVAGQAGKLFTDLFDQPSHTGRIYREGDASRAIAFSDVGVVSLGSAMLVTERGTGDVDLTDALVFVEVPADYTQYVGRNAVNMYADPMLLHFRDQGYRTVKLCRFQRQMPAKQKMVEPAYFLPGVARIGTHMDDLARCRSVIEQINRLLRSANLPQTIDADEMIGRIETVLAFHDAADQWFSHQRPAAVFVQNFANLEKMGVLAAARRHKVPTIDLMHGIQDGLNIYHDHPRIPEGDIYPFPETMWVWGDVTRENMLAAKQRGVAPWRKVEVAGFPWKHAHRVWQRDPRVERLRAMIPEGAKRVLYCHEVSLHNSEFDGYLPVDVLEALQSSRDDVFWLIRVHPRSFHLRDEIASYLHERGVGRFELHLASECLFEDVLRLTDVLVTKYSAAALEAASVGIPAITHHATGAALFETYIESGHITYAKDGRRLLRAISKAEPPSAPLGYVNFSRDRPDVALAATLDKETLLRLAPKKVA
ncbi:hypothetical protein [Arvimicrobium flavum]|uniref:hypothetical protein n=1 Tax=Arvimicrobium flavum TaxID=3393320 RepID=UPI00237A2FB0|nr:hypothetical protein [Mesorhizobium shangrilense]